MVAIETQVTAARAEVAHHRVEVDGYVVSWTERQGLCCFWPDWMNTPITTADIRKLGVILSEIAGRLEKSDG